MSFIEHKISQVGNFYSRKFRTSGKLYNVNFKYNSSEKEYDIIDILDEIEAKFDEIINVILKDYEDDDQIRVALNHDNLDMEIFVPFRSKKYFTSDMLLNEIVKVSQSKREFLLSGKLQFDVKCVRPPRIGGGHHVFGMDEWLRKSKKVIRVSRDSLCIAKCIVLSISKHNNVDKKTWQRLTKDQGKILSRKAMELYQNANISHNNVGITIDSLEKIQAYLGNEYQIIAVTAPDIVMFSGAHSEKQIYLMIDKNKKHSDCLFSLRVFSNRIMFAKNVLFHIRESLVINVFIDVQIVSLTTFVQLNRITIVKNVIEISYPNYASIHISRIKFVK